LNKANPRKERTLALSLGRERGTDFMIPLNVDGLRPTDLPWGYSDLNYIAFQNWATGLEQLLKDLDRMSAPRPLPLEKGRQIAAETFLPHQVLIRKTETLYTNCLSFVQVPELLRVFRVDETFNPAQLDSLASAWPPIFVAMIRAQEHCCPILTRFQLWVQEGRSTLHRIFNSARWEQSTSLLFYPQSMFLAHN
jgi:hypothetical protein